MVKNAGWTAKHRLAGLRRFAIAITVFNVLGHLYLGFEQPWAAPLVALLAAYLVELLLEFVDARANTRPLAFGGRGGLVLIDFLLPAHISALAVSMLIYPNDRLSVFAFAMVAAIASKHLLRAPTVNGTRHFLNPSNFGITVTLLLFPWVGIAPPYQFTENLDGIADWLLPAFIVVSGSFLNWRFARRLPLICAWLVTFMAQAVVRSALLDTPLVPALLPMTGVAFILFTFYMVTDPATTPTEPSRQIVFGAAVGVVYGILIAAHIVFGLFFSLTVVCLVRGAWLYLGTCLPIAGRILGRRQGTAVTVEPATAVLTATSALDSRQRTQATT